MISVLLQSVYSRTSWRDDYCDKRIGTSAVLELILDEEVDVILGPPCSEGKHRPDHDQ